jgi:phage baseplate assembly protein W
MPVKNNYELGRSVSQLKAISDWKNKTVEKESKPIGIKTPLEKGNLKDETLFKMHFNILDQIRDNLKNLIMTQKGERLGFPDYGTRLRAVYSNTSLTDDQIADYASLEIKNVVSKYMPNITLSEFYSSEVDNNDFSRGEDFINKQSSIEISSASSIETKNKKNKNLNKLYLIKIIFSIPLLNSEDNSVILFINNAV